MKKKKMNVAREIELNRQRTGQFGFRTYSEPEILSLIPPRPTDTARVETAERWLDKLRQQADNGISAFNTSRLCAPFRKIAGTDLQVQKDVNRLRGEARHLRRIPMHRWTDEEFISAYSLAHAQRELLGGAKAAGFSGRARLVASGAVKYSVPVGLIASGLVVAGPVGAATAAVAAASTGWWVSRAHRKPVLCEEQRMEQIKTSPEFVRSAYLQVQIAQIDDPNASKDELVTGFSYRRSQMASDGKRALAAATTPPPKVMSEPRVSRRDGRTFPLPHASTWERFKHDHLNRLKRS